MCEINIHIINSSQKGKEVCHLTECAIIFRPDYPGRIIRPTRIWSLQTKGNIQYLARIFGNIRAG